MFTADNARELLNTSQVKVEKGKRNWKIDLEMKKVERKIKACCLKGERTLFLSENTPPTVIAELKSNGYEISQGVIAIVVEW